MSALPRTRLLRRLAVASGFGLVLAFVPLPGMQFVTESVGATTPLPAARAATPAQLAAVRAAASEPLSGDRVISSDPSTPTFTTIGFTFDHQPTEPVLVRVKGADGTYGAWRELGTEADEGPDAGSPERHGAPAAGTEPLWVGTATGYEVSVAATDAPAADVVTVHDEQRRTVTEATPVAGAATTQPPPFSINLRSTWGARAPISTSYGSTVKLAVVHHSASSNSYSPADMPGILRSIQAFHMDGRGWSDIAYNFVVDKYGGIWEGRAGGIDRPVIGAHAMGFNTNTVGVMVVGDYTLTGPTAVSLESVSKVIGWKLALHGVDPNSMVNYVSGGSLTIPAGVTVGLSRVVGHQDVGATDCPGSIHGALGQIRARAQAWTDWVRASSVPVGSLDVVTPGNNTIRIQGWAVDPTVDGPDVVRVFAAGRTQDVVADQARSDVAALYPAYGSARGFDLTMGSVPPGLQDVCVWALDTDGGANSLLGCVTVRVNDPSGTSPVGGFLSVQAFSGGVAVTGWAVDPDVSAPSTVDLLVDGRTVRTLVANAWSPNIPDPWKQSKGTLHAFGDRITGLSAGRHRLCEVIRNAGNGTTLTADCADVQIPK